MIFLVEKSNKALLLFLLFPEPSHSHTHLSSGKEFMFPASRLVSKLFCILQGLAQIYFSTNIYFEHLGHL